MADLPVTPLANYGQLLSSLPLAESEIASQSASQNFTRAQTAQTQATTQGTNIANQGAALKLGLLQKYYQQNQPPGAAQPQQTASSSGDTVGGTNFSPDQVTAGIIQKFAPLPTAPPASAVAQDAYAKAIGAPEVAVATYKTQVEGVNQQKSLGASSVYQMAETVASAPKGAAFETFSRIDPEKAAAFKAAHPSDDPDQLDADARLLAQHTGIAVHQYTGRDTDFQNGVLVDKKSGKPVLGSQQVLTGLDAAGKAGAFASANEQVQIGDQLPQPKWQASGFPSAEAYVIAADKNARSSAASAQPSAPGNTSATAPPPQKLPPAAAVAPVDPVLKSALNDHEYDMKPLPTPKTQEDLKSNNDLRAASNAARTELLSDAKDATNSGAQAMQYMNAAKAIMESKGAPVTGSLGGLVAKLTGPFGSVDATNYQEAAKYLGNAAIQAGKGNFGKGMTQSDVQLQKDELSPSVHMTDAALKDLINAGIKNTQYTLDSGKRVGQYLAKGKDPQRFAEWNDSHFNRSDAVNTTKPAAAGIPTAGVVRGGYKFLGGDPSVKANWSKQ